MADNEHLPALQERHIRWNHFNYPPGLRLMHFVPSEISKQKKFIVLGLFIIHQVVLINSLLNFNHHVSFGDGAGGDSGDNNGDESSTGNNNNGGRVRQGAIYFWVRQQKHK